MGNRKVVIQENAVRRIAETAWHIESNFSALSAKKFIDEIFIVLNKISAPEVTYHPCTYRPWQELGYKCVSFRKKYLIAYLEFESEIIICDFSHAALLK